MDENKNLGFRKGAQANWWNYELIAIIFFLRDANFKEGKSRIKTSTIVLNYRD